MGIALDTTTLSSSVTTATLTFSHNVSGSNKILWVGGYAGGGTDVITGITYNGVAMTRAIGVSQGANGFVYLYYLAAPASGANNVIVSQSGATTIQAVACSYIGAKQTGIPGSSATAVEQVGSNATVNTTTVADNSWLVGVCWTNRTNSNGADTTIRGGVTSQFSMFDSNNAKTPAGSHSLNVTMSSSSTFSIGIVSFEPLLLAKITGVSSITGIQSITF